MRIVDYQPGRHAAAWRQLNLAWISEHYAVEPHDLEQLDDPQTHVLGPGGRIFVAEDAEGEPVGTAALVAMPEDQGGGFELAKMTVGEAARGTGLGRMLLAHAVSAARAAGAPRVYLETNSAAVAAIALYRAAGFVHLPPRPTPYARCDTWMELRF